MVVRSNVEWSAVESCGAPERGTQRGFFWRDVPRVEGEGGEAVYWLAELVVRIAYMPLRSSSEVVEVYGAENS